MLLDCGKIGLVIDIKNLVDLGGVEKWREKCRIWSMSEIFYAVIFKPLYNLLVFLVDFLPGHSLALAVIILTILVKFALLPLAKKMAHTQKKMKEIMPELEKIKKEHKDDKQAQALKIMEVYKREKLNPLSGFANLLIQLPIIFGLYWVFFKAKFPELENKYLYSFIPGPEKVELGFFGINLTEKSLILAFLAGFTQYLYSINMSKDFEIGKSDEGSFKAEFQKSIQMQVKYVLPVIIGFVAYQFSAVIALYFIVSNIFMIAQDLYFKKKGLK